MSQPEVPDAYAAPEGRVHTMDRAALAALADLVADRVLERLGAAGAGAALRDAPAPALLTAREVAARLGLSYDFVREHRDELGVLAGEGARPRLLFDARRVAEFATARSSTVRSRGADSPAGPGHARRRRGSRSGTGPPLLPIRGVSEGDRAA